MAKKTNGQINMAQYNAMELLKERMIKTYGQEGADMIRIERIRVPEYRPYILMNEIMEAIDSGISLEEMVFLADIAEKYPLFCVELARIELSRDRGIEFTKDFIERKCKEAEEEKK